MPSHRSLRMAEAIREVVATAILFDVADPRVRAVTVLRVEVSSDLRFATVFVSIMGSEGRAEAIAPGPGARAGFLQARVAARLQTRFTPVLSFKHDESVKKSVELSRLIDEAVASDRAEAVIESGQSRGRDSQRKRSRSNSAGGEDRSRFEIP